MSECCLEGREKTNQGGPQFLIYDFQTFHDVKAYLYGHTDFCSEDGI